MKRGWWLVVSVVLCVAEGADARLGEDDLQCMMRYGGASQAPAQLAANRNHPLAVGEFSRTKSYFYEDWKIRIGYIGNIASRMEYSKVSGKPLTQKQIDAILKANGTADTWVEVKTAKTLKIEQRIRNAVQLLAGRKWYRADGCRAHLRSNVSLLLETPAAFQRETEQKRAKRLAEDEVPDF